MTAASSGSSDSERNPRGPNGLEFEPLPALPPRDASGHKGTFGTVLVVGGCAHPPRTMLGGAMLAARGALRAGCGRVVVAVPEPHVAAALAILPEATAVALPVDREGVLRASAAAELLDPALDEADAVVVGPALGRSAAAGQVVMRLLSAAQGPIVADADALHAIAVHRDAHLDLRGVAVLTPHPGEAATLAESAGLVVDCIGRATRPAAALALAQRFGAVVALKGAGTVTSDGLRAWRCDRACAALATGGSGDVLAGIVGSFLAQFGPRHARRTAGPLGPACCTALAVEAHARAGEAWAAAHGDAGLLAHEIADLVPAVLRAMRGGGATG